MKQFKPKENGVQLPWNDLDFINKWQEWLQYRAERKIARYVPTGLKRTFTMLKEMSGNDPKVAIKIIDQSLSMGWQGLFKLREVQNEQQQQPVREKATRESVNDIYNQRFGNRQ
jgi:hypothetical protein